MTAMRATAMLTLLLLAGCGPGNEERLAAQRAARMETEAATRLANLRQMQAIGRDDLALNFANDLVQRFPGTAAATEAAPLVAELTAKVDATRERDRLAALWAYHSSDDKDAGGTVRTAYIYSANTLGPAEAGKEAPKARLVLRRHPQWGDDVYLLSDRGHFACATPCTVSVQFDDAAAVTYPAKLPETGEPAMFVEDFVAIVSALPAAQKVRFEIALADGSRHVPEFEVGGYVEDTIGSPLRPQ